MKNYNILSDYEKQQKIKEVTSESKRLNKSKYWILKQLNIPKSTYYDWLKTGGINESKRPKTVWNKTPESIERKITQIRRDTDLYQSERTPKGIAAKLEDYGMYMSSVGVWNVLKRKHENRKFVEEKNTFIIHPRSEKFLGVVCIDDIMLTNRKPRDVAIFNAIDEYSRVSVAISFVNHRSNKHDVIALLEQIKENYGRLPKTVRLDNAKAHVSILVKQYCRYHNIELQFINKGVPQQNWPVESFNGVIRKDLINTVLWKWDDLSDKQELLQNYRKYYNHKKPLDSDPIQRTPNEIATAVTSKKTQERVKYKLLRKHRGQTTAREVILKKQAVFTT